MTLPRSFVRPLVRPLVRSGAVGPYGGATYQDGIHLNFASGSASTGHYVKAVGAAPTVSALTSLFTFTGGNQSMFMGPAGLLVASATNTPRIEYDANGNCLGLLIEAARTNLCLQSQTFDNASWAKAQSSVSQNTTTAPEGTTTADSFIENGASAQHVMTQIGITSLTAATVYCASVFVKAAGRTRGRFIFVDSTQTDGVSVNFNLGTGAVTGATGLGAGTLTASGITAYPSGWYRIWVSGAMNNARTTGGPYINLQDAAGNNSYLGDSVSGLHVWGAQLEAGAFPSSYVPTTTGSIARTADRCIRTLGSEFSGTAGTVVVNGDIQYSVGSTPAIAALHNNAGTGAEEMILYANAGARRWLVTDGGVSQANVLGGSITDGTRGKMAAVYAANDIDLAVNGVMSGLQDTSATLPTMTHLDLMRQDASAITSGHILTFDYWPERRSNAFLQQASA